MKASIKIKKKRSSSSSKDHPNTTHKMFGPWSSNKSKVSNNPPSYPGHRTWANGNGNQSQRFNDSQRNKGFTQQELLSIGKPSTRLLSPHSDSVVRSGGCLLSKQLNAEMWFFKRLSTGIYLSIYDDDDDVAQRSTARRAEYFFSIFLLHLQVTQGRHYDATIHSTTTPICRTNRLLLNRVGNIPRHLH